MKALVTGCAGFIGSHLAERLVRQGDSVVGVDCFTNLYPRRMKEGNLEWLLKQSSFAFLETNLLSCDLDEAARSFPDPKPEGKVVVFHLAAQPGVRSSWGDDFLLYTDNNILATQKLLEWAKDRDIGKLVFASSSSVYGDTAELPMMEDGPLRPVSPYGVTKLAAESLCRLYWRNFGVPAVSLRYFSVYGPRQRPDMGFHRFIRAILRDEDIEIYGDGNQTRDFTYIDDVTDATVAAIEAPDGDVFNVGAGQKISVAESLEALQKLTGRPAKVRYASEQRGDMRHTSADISKAERVLKYHPQVDLKVGLRNQIEWLRRAPASRWVSG